MEKVGSVQGPAGRRCFIDGRVGGQAFTSSPLNVTVLVMQRCSLEAAVVLLEDYSKESKGKIHGAEYSSICTFDKKFWIVIRTHQVTRLDIPLIHR